MTEGQGARARSAALLTVLYACHGLGIGLTVPGSVLALLSAFKPILPSYTPTRMKSLVGVVR